MSQAASSSGDEITVSCTATYVGSADLNSRAHHPRAQRAWPTSRVDDLPTGPRLLWRELSHQRLTGAGRRPATRSSDLARRAPNSDEIRTRSAAIVRYPR